MNRTRPKRIDKRLVPVMTAIMALLLLALTTATAQEDAAAGDVTIASPVLITSAGQSADTAILNALLRRAQVESTVVDVAGEGDLDGVASLLITLGGSQKGLGAAGISMNEEVARVEALLDAADELGITVVGLHIGGEGRRGPLSDPFIQAVAPRAHLLIATNDGNQDGIFSAIADENGIPLVLLDRVNDVGTEVTGRLANE